MNARQEILVIERLSIPEAWRPDEGGVPLCWRTVADWLADGARVGWMARPQAERDVRWKQPIPYLVLRDGEGHVAAYRRAGSEERLHGLWSLGVGGHVERVDEQPALAATLLRCAERELAEEVPGCSAALRFAGVLNEERTGVGMVHWGLVFEASVAHRPEGGPELGALEWLTPTALARRDLELWSRLALALLMPGAR